MVISAKKIVNSFEIETIDFDSWANTHSLQYTKTKKQKNTRDIVHKIFYDCSLIIEDPFWVERFSKAALNKFPQKFSYQDKKLHYRKGTKTISVDVPDNIYHASQIFMEFLRINGGIFSDIDGKNSMDLLLSTNKSKEDQNLTWGKLNKIMKSCLLNKFVLDYKDKYNLTTYQVSQLRQTIDLGISNKFFHKENITLENNNITMIKGLLYDQNRNYFYIDPILKPKLSRNYDRKKECNTPFLDNEIVPQFSIKWREYIDILDKKLNNKRKITVYDDNSFYSVDESSKSKNKTEVSTDVETND